MSFLFHTSGSVGGLGGQPPRSTRPPLASRAGERAFNTERSTSWGVKLFGSPLVFPLLVFLVFVFIGESSITYGVLKRRNPLG